ncbi:hypothetical protein Y032_0032g2584 [Ancylostoma ceylanicum]|uniref:Uncharacterized protein n=1 Tax=Ancylostoma ceylanicum TaxID=53326 RepID=A0A016UP37_9BILA|nr:hypothetical protein Y032_0032g2584 [Ancylostoma ceylanicum]
MSNILPFFILLLVCDVANAKYVEYPCEDSVCNYDRIGIGQAIGWSLLSDFKKKIPNVVCVIYAISVCLHSQIYSYIVEEIYGLRLRFLSVAAAESRRDLLDPLNWSMLSPHPSFRSHSGPSAIVQPRNPSIFLRRTVCK